MTPRNNHTVTIIAIAALMFLSACSGNDKPQNGQRIDALDDSAWEVSTWISAADAPVVTGIIDSRVPAADGSSWFLTTLKNEKKVICAKWMTSGLGIFDLYVNGQLVGDEVLKPGFTHYQKTKRSFTYDITDLINCKSDAENVFSAQVTPGWWGDKIVTPSGSEGMIGKKCAFRGVIELTFADHSTQLYGTDTENWKAGIAGPVKHAAIFDGETYDAREPMGYDTPEKLSTPEVNTEFSGDILPSSGAEVYMRRDLAMTPVRAYVWSEVENADEEHFGTVKIIREYASGEPMTVHPGENLVVDFGQNCAALPSFVFSAREGTELTCLPSELLNDGNGAKSRNVDGPEGSIHRRNLRLDGPFMIIKYTFAESPSSVLFCPRSSFFGYRLVSISATDDVTIEKIESIPVTSITKEMETGRITTGNELVNKLISNSYWGQLSNYLSVPTDCPQRDERLGWTADTQVFTETGSFFANTDRFFHKWMRDMRDTQSGTGAFPGVAPAGQYGSSPNNMMRLGWADAGIIVPWTIWKQFDDKEIIEESWASMEKFLDHVNETRYDHHALKEENGNYQWGDWLSYEPLESNSRRAFPLNAKGQRETLPDAYTYWNYLGASYWAMDAAMMRDMAKATGKDADKYEKMLSEAKSFLKDNFLKDNGEFQTEIFNTMQTPALFALKNGLVEGEALENMKARLLDNFTQHGNCLQTGFLGTAILMETLTDYGMNDMAYELLLQRKNPSWLYSVDNGATTIWERWNSYTKESGIGPLGMNSFNHYAYGCVCAWIWKTAAGIASDVAAPGFKHIIMKPVPDKRLGHLDAEYKSAAGVIRSSWRYDGDTWIWDFTVPKGATATVTLPGASESKDYDSGSYTVKVKL